MFHGEPVDSRSSKPDAVVYAYPFGIVVNLSLGTDFGPHDGTMAWEQTLASYVGPSSPGHALVAAAGNSGSIADAPIHENVYVRSGTTLHVPMSIPTDYVADANLRMDLYRRIAADVRLPLELNLDRHSQTHPSRSRRVTSTPPHRVHDSMGGNLR